MSIYIRPTPTGQDEVKVVSHLSLPIYQPLHFQVRCRDGIHLIITLLNLWHSMKCYSQDCFIFPLQYSYNWLRICEKKLFIFLCSQHFCCIFQGIYLDSLRILLTVFFALFFKVSIIPPTPYVFILFSFFIQPSVKYLYIHGHVSRRYFLSVHIQVATSIKIAAVFFWARIKLEKTAFCKWKHLHQYKAVNWSEEINIQLLNGAFLLCTYEPNWHVHEWAVSNADEFMDLLFSCIFIHPV